MKDEPSVEKYPYEVYCRNCGTTIGYSVGGAKAGDIVRSSSILLLDGTEPKPGDRVVCGCVETKPNLWTRDRKKFEAQVVEEKPGKNEKEYQIETERHGTMTAVFEGKEEATDEELANAAEPRLPRPGRLKRRDR